MISEASMDDTNSDEYAVYLIRKPIEVSIFNSVNFEIMKFVISGVDFWLEQVEIHWRWDDSIEENQIETG